MPAAVDVIALVVVVLTLAHVQNIKSVVIGRDGLQKTGAIDYLRGKKVHVAKYIYFFRKAARYA